MTKDEREQIKTEGWAFRRGRISVGWYYADAAAAYCWVLRRAREGSALHRRAILLDRKR